MSLVRLVEQLDRGRYESCVALPSDGPLVSRLTAAGARVVVLPQLLKLTSRRGRLFLARFAVNYPRAVWSLVRFIRRERIALVHTNTIHNLYGFAAARITGVPHVWHVREIVWQSGVLKRLELWLTRRWSTRLIVTSDAVAGMFGPRADWPPQLVKIPNGVETDRFSPGDGAVTRAQLGAAPDQPLLGLVCRLDMWKGVEVFLDAAASLAAARPHVRFAVVGGPIIGQEPYEGELRRRADRLGIADRVRFAGWQFDPAAMPDVHRALDVLVLASSEPEPFGLVILEAMATAKPVIATAHGGPLEICVEGETGLLVPPRDPAAMARAMIALIDDPARARAMGEAGRRRVLARYTAERYVAAIADVYQSLLGA